MGGRTNERIRVVRMKQSKKITVRKADGTEVSIVLNKIVSWTYKVDEKAKEKSITIHALEGTTTTISGDDELVVKIKVALDNYFGDD
jgi:hypothetical protein